MLHTRFDERDDSLWAVGCSCRCVVQAQCNSVIRGSYCPEQGLILMGVCMCVRMRSVGFVVNRVSSSISGLPTSHIAKAPTDQAEKTICDPPSDIFMAKTFKLYLNSHITINGSSSRYRYKHDISQTTSAPQYNGNPHISKLRNKLSVDIRKTISIIVPHDRNVQHSLRSATCAVRPLPSEGCNVFRLVARRRFRCRWTACEAITVNIPPHVRA